MSWFSQNRSNLKFIFMGLLVYIVFIVEVFFCYLLLLLLETVRFLLKNKGE